MARVRRNLRRNWGVHPHAQCETIERAVAAAVADADEGDVVLLAPACASFDQYRNFELRGDAFIAAVEAATA